MQNNDSWGAFAGLADRYRTAFGGCAGAQIMSILYQELGGMRVTVPTITQIAIMERNASIRARFTGFNLEELALLYGMSERHVRRIVNEQD